MNGRLKLLEAIGDISSEYVLQASIDGETAGKKKRRDWIRYCGIAAAVAIAFFGGIRYFIFQNSLINLTESSDGVTVRYVEGVTNDMSSDQLFPLTEQELFTHFYTDIFMGEVTDVQNIQIDFNGVKMYRALAQISIEKVYRGENLTGKTVTVLLPCAIGTEEKMTDADTLANMQVGLHGIFMITPYDTSSFIETNGVRLALLDIADYGFPDGVRYAFLETEEGLIFDRQSYSTIARAENLSQVEAYIEDMLAKLR